ncbi:hypothetical protein [Sphingomonas baiyangensis]|uniref:hypothetical protein n=1 Tax=Sphingomonas baiyangensis TaxID=2572576 RepID=UPI0010AE894A|nr:hypothetical protein [Sphingomonas baiyangensis]
MMREFGCASRRQTFWLGFFARAGAALLEASAFGARAGSTAVAAAGDEAAAAIAAIAIMGVAKRNI